jgi:signal transduction histidine kinase
LRNPFNSIIGLTDLLLMDLKELPPEKLQKSLENIRDSSTHAHELLENLLLWARSATGTMAFRPEPVPMQKLVEESIELVQAQADARNITIHNECSHNLTIPADENMMKTILRNLLTNAVKFTQPGGDVWVGITSGDGMCVLSVRDNGPGIPHHRMSSLFDIGATQKTRGSGQATGSGLGLILCREMAARHGGTITVTSEEGRGSEFRVIIPLAGLPPEQT